MQQQPQLQGVADLLANQGRYGDSMLVHMNPVEVQGLASMSPTGSLTVNPQTGQPEAFLPFLAPLLGGMLGTSALAGATIGSLTLSPAVAGAIGSGLATAAVEGDLKKGLISGITGFGVGSALGNVFKGAEGAVKAGEQAVAQTTKALESGVPFSQSIASDPELLKTAIEGAASQAGEEATKRFVAGVGDNAMGFQDRIGEVFSRPGDTLKALASPTALIPAAIGEGTNLQIAQDEMAKKMANDHIREKRAYNERGIAMSDSNIYDPNINTEH